MNDTRSSAQDKMQICRIAAARCRARALRTDRLIDRERYLRLASTYERLQDGGQPPFGRAAEAPHAPS